VTGTVTIRGVAKAYAGRPVLSRIDLDVPAGTLTAVLGASGCGKTTLLRVIAGFTTPDAGRIDIAGRTVHHRLPPEDRHIGFVFQEGALFPHLSVAQNVGFGLPRRRRKRRTGEMLALVGLPARYAGRYPHELSGGEQQRVALARALAPEPAVVLLDEPFTSLDAASRAETRNAVMQALAASATTGVLVTHDQSEALSLADQVAVLREGRIVQATDPRTLYQQPVDLAVAQFVGDAVILGAEVTAGIADSPLGRLAVRPTRAPRSGRALLMIRPEQLRWHRANGAPPHAVVTGATYYGHDTVVQLVTNGNSPPTTLNLRTRSHHAPRPGDSVRLSVDGPVMAYPAANTLAERGRYELDSDRQQPTACRCAW
jgi:iron(III) transport system ATP-binding protein